jgi:hypothetical protein
MKFPYFEAKAGILGQYGWKKVSFWRWIQLWGSNHLVRIKFK